jgi:hypothetical protein
MKLAVSLRCRSRFQNATRRPSALQAHLSGQRMPGKFVLIAYTAHASLRQIVVHHAFVAIDYVPGTEAQPGERHHLPPSEFKAKLARMFDQPGMHFDDRRRRNRQADQCGQARAKPVVGQHPRVLRVF